MASRTLPPSPAPLQYAQRYPAASFATRQRPLRGLYPQTRMAVASPLSTTVCVCNLPDFLTDREFRFLFKFAWGFERASINRTKAGHQVGYARFSSIAEAQQALEYLQGFPLDEDFPNPVKCFMSTTQLNDELLDNKANMVGMKRPYSALTSVPDSPTAYPYQSYAPRPFKRANPLSIYIGGIPHDWDDNQLSQLFAPFGAISSIQITEGKNQELGKIAFVYFSAPAEATAAIDAMNNYPLDDGKHLVVRQNTSNPTKKTDQAA
jgi:hypothetical protein